MTKADARLYAKKVLQEFTSLTVSFQIENFLSDFLIPKKKVISYRFHPPEINLDFLEEKYPKISFFYPKIVSKNQKLLVFVKPRGWERGEYGIWEPQGVEIISPEKADLCIIPCLGCNSQGFRLGRGGGFYDKAMKNVLRNKLVGITLWELTNLNFEAEPHDIQVGIIITERGVIFYES